MRTFGHRSRTPHGVRELKLLIICKHNAQSCRTPHGVRELKLRCCYMGYCDIGRTPHGVRELKHSSFNWRWCVSCRRTPHGVRELKPFGWSVILI